MVRRFALALALLAAGGVAATLLGLGTAGAGGPSSVQTVREQNVDAQGNIKVAEQGTPSVSLTGSPRVGLEPTLGNTVKIDPNVNTVKIDPTAGAIPTTATDNPAFSPVVTSARAEWAEGQFVTSRVVYTVPSGRELVIEQISIVTEEDLSAAFFQVLGTEGSPVSFALSTTPQLTSGGSPAGSIGDMQTRIYAPPGSDVVCQAERNTIFREFPIADCSISGYLVPAK